MPKASRPTSISAIVIARIVVIVADMQHPFAKC
jgi:hypothetical protein